MSQALCCLLYHWLAASLGLFTSLFISHVNNYIADILCVEWKLWKETIQVNTLNMYFDGKAVSFMNENENEKWWRCLYGLFPLCTRKSLRAGSWLFYLCPSTMRSLLDDDPWRGECMDCFGCFQGFPRLTALVVLFSFSSPPQVFLSLGSEGYC